MANNSEKKQLKLKEKYTPILIALTSGFLIFYFLSILFSLYRGTFSNLQILLFVVYLLINAFCFRNLQKGLEMGLNSEFFNKNIYRYLWSE